MLKSGNTIHSNGQNEELHRYCYNAKYINSIPNFLIIITLITIVIKQRNGRSKNKNWKKYLSKY